MAQRLRFDNADVIILTDSQFQQVLELARSSQDARVKDVRIVITVPDGTPPSEIAKLLEAAREDTTT